MSELNGMREDPVHQALFAFLKTVGEFLRNLGRDIFYDNRHGFLRGPGNQAVPGSKRKILNYCRPQPDEYVGRGSRRPVF
jgi:hypothetical protein